MLEIDVRKLMKKEFGKDPWGSQPIVTGYKNGYMLDQESALLNKLSKDGKIDDFTIASIDVDYPDSENYEQRVMRYFDNDINYTLRRLAEASKEAKSYIDNNDPSKIKYSHDLRKELYNIREEFGKFADEYVVDGDEFKVNEWKKIYYDIKELSDGSITDILNFTTNPENTEYIEYAKEKHEKEKEKPVEEVVEIPEDDIDYDLINK